MKPRPVTIYSSNLKEIWCRFGFNRFPEDPVAVNRSPLGHGITFCLGDECGAFVLTNIEKVGYAGYCGADHKQSEF